MEFLLLRGHTAKGSAQSPRCVRYMLVVWVCSRCNKLPCLGWVGQALNTCNFLLFCYPCQALRADLCSVRIVLCTFSGPGGQVPQFMYASRGDCPHFFHLWRLQTLDRGQQTMWKCEDWRLCLDHVHAAWSYWRYDDIWIIHRLNLWYGAAKTAFMG